MSYLGGRPENGKPYAKYEGFDVDDPANADRFVQFSNVVFDDRFVPWPYSADSRGYRRPDSVRLRAVAKSAGSHDTAIASNPERPGGCHVRRKQQNVGAFYLRPRRSGCDHKAL